MKLIVFFGFLLNRNSAPSECCNYPSELDLSCLKGNEVICRIYNSWCGNLSSNATVQFDAVLPPVSSSIARWCDETLVEVSNGQACKKAWYVFLIVQVVIATYAF
jgi:hypothetical protein